MPPKWMKVYDSYLSREPVLVVSKDGTAMVKYID